ncbi:hypothetical protein BH11MYX1_BH11MYX1_17770 [soil metagenome]
MMRGVLSSLIVVSLLGGVAFADEPQPADPMPVEQGPAKPAEAPKAAMDDKFEIVKKAPPTEGVKPSAENQKLGAKSAKHKAKRKARKHKKAHRKAKKSAP